MTVSPSRDHLTAYRDRLAQLSVDPRKCWGPNPLGGILRHSRWTSQCCCRLSPSRSSGCPRLSTPTLLGRGSEGGGAAPGTEEPRPTPALGGSRTLPPGRGTVREIAVRIVFDDGRPRPLVTMVSLPRQRAPLSSDRVLAPGNSAATLGNPVMMSSNSNAEPAAVSWPRSPANATWSACASLRRRWFLCRGRPAGSAGAENAPILWSPGRACSSFTYCTPQDRVRGPRPKADKFRPAMRMIEKLAAVVPAFHCQRLVRLGTMWLRMTVREEIPTMQWL